MYDIEKDIENVAREFTLAKHKGTGYYESCTKERREEIIELYSKRQSTRNAARASLNASTAVKQLKELNRVWLIYKSDMRPETRNNFLRVCSSIFDITPSRQEEKVKDEYTSVL